MDCISLVRDSNKLKTTYLNGKVNRRIDFVEERPPLLAAQSAQEGNHHREYPAKKGSTQNKEDEQLNTFT